MPRSFVLTVAVCVWGFVAAVALADKGDPAEQNEKARLLKQIAELKLMVAKLHNVTAQRQAEAEKQRAVAEHARLAAEKRLAAEHQNRQFAEKGAHKGPHPGHREAMERLENIRAAVKHLNAAGLKEIAAAVAKHGEQIQAGIEKSPKGQFKPGRFRTGPPLFHKGGPQPPFKGGKPSFLKGGPQPSFKGGKPGFPKGGPPQFVKGPQPPQFKGGRLHKPADGALNHHLNEMSEAIGRLSKQVDQLQKTVAELQKRK